MNFPKLITFDLGGTLIRPYPSVGHVYAKACAEHGYRVEVDPINERFPRTFKAVHSQTKNDARDDQALWKMIVRQALDLPDLPEADFEKIFFTAYEAFGHSETWQLVSGAPETLENLNQLGIRLAVISNADSRMRQVLRDFQIIDYFEALFISAEIGIEKPDPRIFQTVMRQMNVTPAEILHLGDSPTQDIAPAQALGWSTCLRSEFTSISAQNLLQSFHAV